MLNVLKKLSYFTDHPGKQFEYIFAPFIHPEASVAGNEALEIEDVNSPVGGVSLKFLESANPVVEGSKGNIINKINSIQDEKLKFVDYIIVRPAGNGVVEFARIGITTDLKFATTFYNKVDVASVTNILFQLKSGGQSTINGMPAYLYYISLDSSEKASLKSLEKVSLPNLGEEEFDFGGIKIAAKQIAYKKKDKIEQLARKTFPEFIQELNANLKDKTKLLKYLELIPDWQNQKNIKSAEQYAIELINRAKQINVDASKITNLAAPERKQTNENIEDTQKQSKEKSIGKFKIDVTDKWRAFIVKYLNLGDVNSYNEQQIAFNNALAKTYRDTLNDLNDLTTNITKYFATAGNDDSGTKAIINASNIKKNLTQIVTKE
jgi:hypothetical protein